MLDTGHDRSNPALVSLDRRDVERIYRDHGHLVLRRARQILGDEAEAREVLQEVFTALLDRPEQFTGDAAPSTYLYAMTTHRCFNLLRDARTRSRLLADRVAPATDRAGGSDAEAHALLRQLLARVPLDEARAAFHYYLDGMTRPEVAAELGCSLRQVGNLLNRLAERLRDERESATS